MASHLGPASSPPREYLHLLPASSNTSSFLPPQPPPPPTPEHLSPHLATPIPRDRSHANNPLDWTGSDWTGKTPSLVDNHFWNTNTCNKSTNGIANNAAKSTPPFSIEGDDPFLDTSPQLSTPSLQSPNPNEFWYTKLEPSSSSRLAPETAAYQSKFDSNFFWNRAFDITYNEPPPFAFASSTVSERSSPGNLSECSKTPSPPSWFTTRPKSEHKSSRSSESQPSIYQSSSKSSTKRSSRARTPYSGSQSNRTRKGKSSPHRSLSTVRKRPRGRPKPHLTRTPDLPSYIVHFVPAKLVIPEEKVYSYPRAIKPPWREESRLDVIMAPSVR